MNRENLPSEPLSEFRIDFESSAPPEKTRVLLPAILLAATFLTTLGAGFWFHIGFVSSTPDEAMVLLTRAFTHPLDLLHGLPFSLAILLILLAHEMGHYLTCRHYGIKATLPYVIPAPPPFMFGTFGAIIRIKSMFANRRQLFDVGIAGPLAGFVFIVPILILGLYNSKVFIFTVSAEGGLEFGEPLLFRLAAWLFFPGGAEASINLHPIGWAAWFGMLATSLNLLPIGQLDGGHIVYAILGPRGHRIVSRITFVALIAVSLSSWPMPAYLLFAMILLCLGFRHPQPHSEFPSLDKGRLLLALAGLILLILTFIVVPVRVVSHVGQL